MYTTSDFRKNLKVLIDDQPYVITDFQHVKPGKGNQFTRTKLRNMMTGSNLEKTFKSGEKFGVPDVMTRDCTYLYQDDTGCNFMDRESFEQYLMPPEDVGDGMNYLLENLEVTVMFFNGKPIGVDFPNTVILMVAETDPGLKGNTVTGGSKPAKLETGYSVQVPLHINEGDKLKIDTRTGAYVERANN